MDESVMEAMSWPRDFAFGTATASYQIEGAVNEGGRVPSMWDTFCAVPGNIVDGDSGANATDSYHRWRDDIELLRGLGVNAYRFSIAMPRVIGGPDGHVNTQGLDHYDRIVDALCEAGIRPAVTLYHWDLPQYLADEGGWLNRDTAYRLADYAGAVSQRLADRVDTWITLNEPWCSAYLGYGGTEHAPGLGAGPVAFAAAHHLNLAHGLMTKAIRSQAGDRSKVAVTLNLQANRGDADAVHRLDLIANRVFLDPMLRGRYPDELLADTRSICDWDFVHDGDLALIHQPIDALGINYYSTGLVRMSDRPRLPQSTQASTFPGASDVDWLPTQGPHTDMGWNIDPEGLYDMLMRVHDDYPQIPLLVTENGMACQDRPVREADGHEAVHDTDRIDYLSRHIAAMHRAIADGADVRGYFLWSLLDNFEWANGYSKRFGITYVDYATQRRIPKDSYYWYQRLMRSVRSARTL